MYDYKAKFKFNLSGKEITVDTLIKKVTVDTYFQ